MKKEKNAYDFLEIIHNNLNDAMNAMNHMKHKLKHDVVKHEQLNK